MTQQEQNEAILSLKQVYEGPFYYDDHGQKIFDRNNQQVVDIRGWGHISKVMKNPEAAFEAQDNIGKLIAFKLNEVYGIK